MSATTKPSRQRGAKKTIAPEVERLETRNMGTVVRALVRVQTRALAFERLAIVAGDLLRGNDTCPPQLLLKLPGGGAFPADIEDVLELEADLAQLASVERVKIRSLLASAVHVQANDVDRAQSPQVSYEPAPEGESLESNPNFKPTSMAGSTASRR